MSEILKKFYSISNLVLLLLIFISCGNKHVSYEYMMVRNGEFLIWRDSVPINVKSSLENGEWSIDDKEGNTLMTGKFQNGFKKDEWIYHPSQTETVSVNWSKFVKKDYSVEINFPSNWTVGDIEERPFQAIFPTEDEGDDKFFVILSHNKDSIEMDLNEYWNYYRDELSKSEVKGSLFLELKRSDRSFYYSEYTIVKDREEIFVLNFLGNYDSMIYDVTYSSSNNNTVKKQIIFLDMIRSLILPGQYRFFSPFDQKTVVTNLTRPANSSLSFVERPILFGHLVE